MAEKRFDVEADAAALNRRAWELVETEPEAALELSRRALELAEDAAERARSLRTRAAVHNASHRYEQAGAAIEAALAERGLDEPLRLELLVLACRIHYSLGAYERVLAYGAEAAPLAERLEDKRAAAGLLNVMGHSYRVLGLYAEALEVYQSSFRLYEGLGDLRRTHPLGGLASVYEHLGQPDQARAYYREALELEEAAGLEHDAAVTRSCLGNWHLRYGDKAEAERALTASLQVFEALGDGYNCVAVRLKLGDLYRETGRAEQALEQYRRAQEPKPTPWHAALIHLATARLYRDQGEQMLALQHARQALAEIEGREIRQATCDVHLELADLYEACDEPNLALRHLRRYQEGRDALADRDARRVQQAFMVRFETERARQEQEIYRLTNVELAKANLKLRSLQKELERLSQEDPLTGLPNRRSFDLRLTTEIERARRYRHQLAVMVADIDNFKQVNDAHSHALGDAALQIVAELLDAATRSSDMVARYGGEEFVALFPETSLEQARALCETLRRSVEQYAWDGLAPGLNITLSIGLSALRPNDVPGQLLERADRLLYAAKLAGKNSVCSD